MGIHQSQGSKTTRALGRETKIDILVNNIGHGFRGRSWEMPIEQEISVVRLNIEAVLRLTKYFLPPMVQRRSGRIF